MKELKRTLCAILVLVMLIALCIPVQAASPKQLETIIDFSQMLSYNQFYLLRNGKYKAVELYGSSTSCGEWYYRFDANKDGTDYYVLVKASAFQKIPSNTRLNSYDEINNCLTDGVMGKAGIDDAIHIYKRQSTETYKTTDGRTGTDCYTYLTNFTFLSTTDEVNMIRLMCTMHEQVLFHYSDFVGKTPSANSALIRPETSDQYKRALYRSNGDGIPQTVTPQFSVSIDQAGDSNVIIDNCQFMTKATVKKNSDIASLISIVYTTGRIISTTAAGGLGHSDILKNIYGLGENAITLVESSKEWQLTPPILISKQYNGKNYRVLSTKVTSPQSLNTNNDYFETDVYLRGKPSKTGTKTKISIGFSTVEDVDAGTYFIEAYCGKIVEVSNSNKKNKANVQIWTRSSRDLGCQKWKIEPAGDGYVLTAIHSGKAMDVSNGSIESGTNVWQWEVNGTAAQKWYFEDAGNGYIYIRSALGTYLDVSGNKTANGTNVWTYYFNGSNAQKFRLIKVG